MSAIDLRPRLGRPPERKSGERFLFVCFFDPAGIATVYENIALWRRFSRHAIEILNLWPGRGTNLTVPATIALEDYSGLIVHSTASYHPDNLYSLDRNLARPFEEYDGLKILMKQDEHFHTGKFAAYIGEKRFDLVITCVSPQEQAKVYPRNIVGEAELLHAFAGYVSPFMRALSYRPAAERPLDIAYRGSIQPLSFGRLGFEKRKIGYDVHRVVTGCPLIADISSRWEDRIGGTAWFDFLGRSRAVLGVESGTKLFDFTGEVDAWCAEFIKSQPDCDHLSEEFYNRAHAEFLHKYEGNVNYAQISPRHFEAAATRTVQILYEGHYSGVFIPHRHFLPLRRDLANFAEIVDFIADDNRMRDMTECAFEEIIQNQQYHYENFVARFDCAVDRVLQKKGRRARTTPGAMQNASPRRALLLMAHEPTADPRIGWMAQGLSAEFAVCELGLHAEPTEATGPSYERLPGRRMRVRLGRRRHDWVATPDLAKEGSDGVRELTALHVIAELPAKALGRSIGALDATDEDLSRFRWLARHFLHANNALIQAGRLIGGFDVVVAADLDTLPAALALAEEYGAAVLYDAHEFWPYAIMGFRHWEVEFWSAFERKLAPHADLRVTVSPQLAEMMSREYGCEFLSLPNCASKSSVNPVDVEVALRRQAKRAQTDFLFLGNFAAGRGIEDLITAWRHVDKRARLFLQGPDSPFKTEMIELARREGVLDDGASFPQPVDTGELVNAARVADVGIIPYAPSSLNNRYCSPNKLSQYMAAGLPIVCNETEFVKSVVVGNRIGVCVDFRDHRALARVIDELAASKQGIAEMSRRSHRLFHDEFNWETASRDLYARLGEIVSRKPARARADLDFSWIEKGREMRVPADELQGGASIFADAEVNRLSAEVARLNTFYPAEIGRLNEVYTADSARLHDYYTAQIAQLNTEIARVNDAYATEIAQLNTEAARLNEVYPAEIARLNRTIGDLSAASLAAPHGLAGRMWTIAALALLRPRAGAPPESRFGRRLLWRVPPALAAWAPAVVKREIKRRIGGLPPRS